MKRILVASMSAMAFWFAVTSATAADLSSAVDVNIAPQPLASALLQFSAQTQIQIMTAGADVRDLSTSGFSGRMTVGEALRKLLLGSGLSFKLMGDNTVGLVHEAQSPARTESQGASPPSLRDKRAAQDPGSGRGLRLSQSAVSSAAAADTANASQGPDSEKPRELEEVRVTIPEVLVVGSKIINADIPRTVDDPQPYVVFDREQIQASMSSNLEEFFKTRLPMNTVQTSNAQMGTAFGNQSSIDLRGLGTNQTLILVNGRRMPSVSAVAYGGRFSQPDINGIPLSAIERIEVLPSTAGGIYGGGATGGVVNIVMKTDYSGIEARATYENAFDVSAAQRRIEGNAGFSFAEGRTNAMLSASYSDSDPLLSGDRDFGKRGRALLLRNNPAAVYNASDPPVGYTTNIRSVSGANLVLDDGTPLNSPITYVPVGYAGPASDGGRALVANAGQYNLDLPDDLSGGGLRQSLINNPTTKSVSLNLRQAIGNRIDTFIDASWFRNEGTMVGAGLANTLLLFPNSPINPFNTFVWAAWPTTGVSFETPSDSETSRAVGGVILRLPHEWAAQAEYGWARSRFESANTFVLANEQVLPALRDGSLNVMRDLNKYPLELSGVYAVPSPSFVDGPFDTVLNTLSTRLSGPLLHLRGGAWTLTALLERREERAEEAFSDALSDAGNGVTSFVSYYPEREQTVDSLYVETRLPLVSGVNARPGLQGLELQASVRHDRYETTGVENLALDVPSREGPLPTVDYATGKVKSTDFTLGLRYMPFRSLALRASYGTGFLPPSIDQIASRDLHATETFVDPKRGGEEIEYEFTETTGGNRSLRPEESESWSAGLVLTPEVVSGLRLSVDYTRIRKSMEISRLSGAEILRLEDAFPGRVTRAPAVSTDPPGYAGRVIALDTTLVNLARTNVQAYDLQLDYRWQTQLGSFSVFALGTMQTALERQILSTSAVVDRVGFSDGPLEWRGNGGLTWERNGWGAGWNIRYYDHYRIYASDADPVSAARAVLNQGSATVPRQIFHDAFARYRFSELTKRAGNLLSGLEVMFGIQNVFNTSPEIIAGRAGGYSTYGDARMRYYSLSLRVGF